MRRATFYLFVFGALTAIFVSPGFADKGWTSFGRISLLNISATEVSFLIPGVLNPSGCATNNWFSYIGDSAVVNRYYAAALVSINTGAEVRVWQNDTCKSNGTTIIRLIGTRP